MKELFAKIEKIRNLYLNDFDFYYTYRHEIAENLCIEYPNIPIDIMEYYFVRHVNQGLETLRDLPNINAKEIRVSKIELSKKDLLDENLIQNAPFTSYGKPIVFEDCRSGMYDYYKNTYFKNGSWEYPIITIKVGNKLWVVDGTNRFRHMLSCLVNKFDFIAPKHQVYILNS